MNLNSSLYEIKDKYPIKISSHIREVFQTNRSNAIKMQFWPDFRELLFKEGVGAYFPEEKRITSVLTQKYPNRCIIYTTSQCFANCRHCSRKEKWKEQYKFSRYDFDVAIREIRKNTQIDEVVLTGGDVLCNSNKDLEFMLMKLSQIDHVKIIRLGTRVFSVNPKRINEDLLDILAKHDNIVVLTQINHIHEFTPQSTGALKKIQRIGIPILNQFVLLKGINDEYSDIKELLIECGRNRVIPYYMYHCFNVRSTQYFRTDVSTGISIINKLVGNIGGWLIPRYIIIPEETGIKVPIAPNGLIEASDTEIKIQDYKKRVIKYSSLNHKT